MKITSQAFDTYDMLGKLTIIINTLKCMNNLSSIKIDDSGIKSIGIIRSIVKEIDENLMLLARKYYNC